MQYAVKSWYEGIYCDLSSQKVDMVICGITVHGGNERVAIAAICGLQLIHINTHGSLDMAAVCGPTVSAEEMKG